LYDCPDVVVVSPESAAARPLEAAITGGVVLGRAHTRYAVHRTDGEGRVASVDVYVAFRCSGQSLQKEELEVPARVLMYRQFKAHLSSDQQSLTAPNMNASRLLFALLLIGMVSARGSSLLSVSVISLEIFGVSAGWFSGRRRRRRTQTVCDEVPVEVEDGPAQKQCKPTTRNRTSLRNVTKFKKGMKNVTKFEKATRYFNRTEWVEYRLPLEDFRPEARQQIIKETRESLRDRTSASQSTKVEVPFSSTEDGAEAIIAWGPSQAGKSTMVCQLKKSTDVECPKKGDGSGESTTATPRLWDTIMGYVCDNPGGQDTLLRFSAEDVGRWVATALAEGGVRRVKFLVVDSMSNDLMLLRETLASLFTSFGTNAKHGTVVVASKVNLASNRARRINLLREVMESQDIKELVEWYGPDLHQQSLEDLSASLGRVPSIPIAALDDLWERQERRANELFHNQLPRWEEVQVELAEDYLENKTVEEPYEIPYTEEEPYEEAYESEECFWAPIKKTVLKKDNCRIVEV
ncbi:unnamed protein product, partial [Symbiodinium microadriaticum]